MSSISRDLHIFNCIRAAGTDGPQGGPKSGGTYYPGFTNSAGKQVTSRWEGNFFINHRRYTDAQGITQEGKKDVVRLTAWSGKNSNGAGMAEQFAKIISPGLEISCWATLNMYKGDVWDDGGPAQANNPNKIRTRVLRADGTPIQTTKIGFVVMPNSIIIGEESDKHIYNEVLLFQQTGGQKGRPAQWNITGHPDNQMFKQMSQLRNAAVYQAGMPTFGYAIVAPPKNGQMTPYNNAMPAMPNMVNNVVNTVAMTPMVEGYTIAQWKAAGMTEQQMLLSPKFEPFHQLIKGSMLVGGNSVTPTNMANGPYLSPQPTMNNVPMPNTQNMVAGTNWAF